MKKLLTVLFTFVMLFSLCAGAITLDTAESAAEVMGEEAAVLASEVADTTEVHPTYGKLIYYQDFDSFESGSFTASSGTNLIDNGIDSAISGVSGNLSIVDKDESGEDKYLKIDMTGSWASTIFNITDLTDVGTYYVVADFYEPTGYSGGMQCYYYFPNSERQTCGYTGTRVKGQWVENFSCSSTVVNEADHVANKKDFAKAITNIYVFTSGGNYTGSYVGIDNVRVYYVPKGKVTVNDTVNTMNIPKKEDGTYVTGFTSTYVYNGTYKTVDFTTLSYVSLTDSYYIPGYAFDGWYDKDGNKVTADTLVGGMDLYANWIKTAPGINALTGTTAPADFEDGQKKGIAAYQNKADFNVSIKDNSNGTMGTGNNTKVLAVNPTSTIYIMTAFPVTFESGRRYEVKYDAYFSKASSSLSSYPTWFYAIKNTSETATAMYSYGTSDNNKAGKWESKTQIIDATNTETFSLRIQQKISTETTSGVDATELASVRTQPVYYDNISFIPYYKVTYMNWDGSEAFHSEWFLRDSDGKVMTTYTPFAAGVLASPWNGEGAKKFVGWSTEGVNGAVVTSVTLENKDLVFYPVYEDVDAYVSNTIISAKSGKKTGIYVYKNLDMEATTIDVGSSEATYAYNAKNNSLVFSAAGYAGVVTINAVFTDGTSEKIVIKLHGGEKWKPGLNLLTGTTEAYSFNGLTLDEAKVSFTFNGGTGITANPVENSAVNSSATVALHGNGNVEYPVINTMQTQVIESGRGVYASFDYYGSFDNCWLIYAPNSIYYDLSGNKVVSSGKVDWTHAWTYAVANKDIKNLTLQNDAGSAGAFKSFYYDNLNFTPAYKFTYVDVDGTEVVKYAITDASGGIITSYTPDAANFASGVTSYKLSEDGEVYSIDTPIALANEDVVIYAAADAETPGTVSGQEMRFDTEDGNVVSSIRFKGYISVSNQSKANEYGFIATRKTFLDKMDELAASDSTLETELTFDFKYNGADLFVSGAAYALDENGEEIVNKSIGNDEDGNILFAAVLTGIANDNADQVNEVLVARPYVKYVNGDKEFVFYGATAENSLAGVAKAVDTSVLPEEQKASIDAIVALAN